MKKGKTAPASAGDIGDGFHSDFIDDKPFDWSDKTARVALEDEAILRFHSERGR